MPDIDRQFIFAFPKNNGEEIQIAIRKYQGKLYIDLRQWFRKSEATGALSPTQKGVIFPMERLPEFKEGVHKLVNACDKIPMQGDRPHDNCKSE